MEKYYYIGIYLDDQLVEVPHFKLNVVGEDVPGGKAQYRTVEVKATFSKLNGQISYDRFQQKFLKAIVAYNKQLEGWYTTILYRCLEAYSTLCDFSVDDSTYLNGGQSMQAASPLAQIYNIELSNSKRLDEDSWVREYDTFTMQTTFNIQGKEFTIGDPHFTRWLLDIAKQQIIDDNVPYSLGIDMIRLRQALIDSSSNDLESLANAQPAKPLIQGRDFTSRFCLSVHNTICTILDKDVNKFEVEQLELYSFLTETFNVPFASQYDINNSADENRKIVIDRFRLLLKRSSDK
ncbi:MAG: hypothetical protein EOO89_07960 [Pedobacter sp.]|nr:MAG: hypothetical protein EOO89_07960 [Pedobacter sp.]